MSLGSSMRPVTSESDSDSDYTYDLTDLSAALGVELGPNSLESEDPETLGSSTKRRFEFLNSSSLVQSEIYLKSPRTSGSLGADSGSEGPAMDHTRLIMPIHQILSVLCKKVIARALNSGPSNSADAKGNREHTDILVSIIGAGGFALPSHLLALNPSLSEGSALTVHAVEPEEKVLRAARDFFGAEFSMSGEGASRGSKSTQVIAFGTDGLTYLRELSTSNESKSSSNVDLLVIDAFEETPPPGFGPADSYSNRAPPSSLVSTPSLFVDCLRPCSSGIGSEDRDSGSRETESGQKGLKSLENILSDRGGGGVLVINLFGPSEWIQEVYTTVQSCPGLSHPVLLRIKGEKNILLVSSRTSGVRSSL
jgi:hypothetical protein